MIIYNYCCYEPNLNGDFLKKYGRFRRFIIELEACRPSSDQVRLQTL